MRAHIFLLAIFSMPLTAHADPFSPGGTEKTRPSQSGHLDAEIASLRARIAQMETTLNRNEKDKRVNVDDAVSGQALTENIPPSMLARFVPVGKINGRYFVELNGAHISVSESVFDQVQRLAITNSEPEDAPKEP